MCVCVCVCVRAGAEGQYFIDYRSCWAKQCHTLRNAVYYQHYQYQVAAEGDRGSREATL